MLGERILTARNFPEELLTIPVEHINVRRVVASVDYADVVIVAKLQCQRGRQAFLPVEEWSSVSAFNRLGLSADPHVLEAEGLSEEMQENIPAYM